MHAQGEHACNTSIIPSIFPINREELIAPNIDYLLSCIQMPKSSLLFSHEKTPYLDSRRRGGKKGSK